MNREILYRGKRVDNGEWIEGFYVDHDRKSYIYTGKRECIILPIYAEKASKYEVSPETVCQYTGLTDKNGRRIFEWNIVKHDISDTIGTVKWYCEDYAGWCVDDIHIGEQQFTDEMWNECEVIGNIFDNPDLLKE